MKTLLKIAIATVLLLNVVSLFAQEQITINVSQDAKLLFFGDGKKLEAGTLDLTISSEWQGKQQRNGFMFIRPEYEVANLYHGQYTRYSANVGWTFNKLVEDVNFTTSIGYGFLNYNGAAQSLGFNFQLGYEIFKNVEFFLDWEITERRDLIKYESESKILGTVFRGSGKFGFKIALFNTKYKR